MHTGVAVQLYITAPLLPPILHVNVHILYTYVRSNLTQYGEPYIRVYGPIRTSLLLENFRLVDAVGEPWIKTCRFCWDESKQGYSCRGSHDDWPCKLVEPDGDGYRWPKGEAPYPTLYKQKGMLVLQNMRGCTNGWAEQPRY